MKKYIRAVALLLSVIMVIPCMYGCAEKKRVIYSIGNAEITEDLYRYWLSYYKSYYDRYFEDIEDTKEGWQIEISEGVTAEQYVKDMVDERMKMYVCALYLYDEYDLEFSSSAKDYITATIEEQIEYYGGRAAFENALYRSCNISIEGLEKTYEIESKVSQLQQYLYGKGGVEEVSDEMLDKYYQDNYSRIKYLYFDRENKYVYDDEGEIKKNSSGEYMTEALTDAEKEAVKAKAEEAYEKAKEGVDFNDLIAVFNTPDMNFAQTHPDGFYISGNSYSAKYVYTLVSEGMSMKTGEIKLVEDEYAFYVIAKFGLINGAYKNDETNQFESFESYAVQYFYEEHLKALFDKVTVDSDYISKLGVMDVGTSVNV